MYSIFLSLIFLLHSLNASSANENSAYENFEFSLPSYFHLQYSKDSIQSSSLTAAVDFQTAWQDRVGLGMARNFPAHDSNSLQTTSLRASYTTNPLQEWSATGIFENWGHRSELKTNSGKAGLIWSPLPFTIQGNGLLRAINIYQENSTQKIFQTYNTGVELQATYSLGYRWLLALGVAYYFYEYSSAGLENILSAPTTKINAFTLASGFEEYSVNTSLSYYLKKYSLAFYYNHIDLFLGTDYIDTLSLAGGYEWSKQINTTAEIGISLLTHSPSTTITSLAISYSW